MIKKIALVSMTALAAVHVAPVSAKDTCGAEWRTVTDPIAGATYDMAAEPRRSYFIAYDDNYPSSSYEQNWLKDLDCATFSAAIWDMEYKPITNAEVFFDSHQAKMATPQRTVHWSISLKIGGFPAREFVISRNADLNGKDPYYRTLLIARNNKLLMFNSNWSGAGTSPIADRAFASIKLIPLAPNDNLRTYALLSEAITKFWMFPTESTDYSVYFTAELLSRLKTNRTADTNIVNGFGYPRDFTFIQKTTAGKVIRVTHDNASVDWTVQDNGKVFTSISGTRR